MEKAEPASRRRRDPRGSRQMRADVLICLLCALVMVVFVVLDFGFLQRLEWWAGDELTGQRGGGAVDDQLVFVGIDDDSLNVLDVVDEEEILASPELDAMSYGYPFPRSVYAAMTQKLLDAGADLIVFDMLFKTSGGDDAAFKAVIEENPGKVVIGSNYFEREDPHRRGGAPIGSVDLPSPTVIESNDPMDPRIGLVNFFPDGDSKLRTVKTVLRAYANEEEPLRHSLAVAALKQLDPEAKIDLSGAERPIRFPDFSGPDSPYVPIPFYTLFLDEFWEKNYAGGEAFRDKIVYIGGSSEVAFHDRVSIPGEEILGAQAQMCAFAALRREAYYTIVGKSGKVLSVLVMTTVAFGIAFISRHPLVGLLALGACVAVSLLIVRWLYFDFSILLPSAAPVLTLGVAGFGCFGNQFVRERLEKMRLRRTLERQVSKELADHILSMPEGYFQSLPGVRKPVTVLFSDIRSFTARSEEDDPGDLVSQLKEYLNAMGKIVFEHGGVVDKFIGDAVMAVWGLLHSEGEGADARSAVAAAVAMQVRLQELNVKWQKEGRKPFKVGIGLNYGDAIFCMMGSEEKEEMTVIGDPVNQAARLEGLTKKFGLDIIIGSRVVRMLGEEMLLRSLGKVRTVGKGESEELSAVLWDSDHHAEGEQKNWLKRYHAALDGYRAGNLKVARESFRVCLDEVPEDRTCAMYLEAIERGESNGELTMSDK